MDFEEKPSPPASVLSRRLPDLVVESLLKYLDFLALKTLRLVCKTTKSWVETPDRLRHFVVRINGEARLNDLISSPDPVSWNSFSFTQLCKYSPELLERFLAAYGKIVVHLEFNWFWEKDKQQAQKNALHLLSGCHHLESLQINELNIGHISNAQTRRLIKMWKNLRHFSLNRFHYDRTRLVREMSFFTQILSTCTRLEILTVPHFSYLYDLETDLQIADGFQQLVVTPQLDTIRKGRLREVQVPYDRFSREHFLQIAIACREAGTVLHTQNYLERLSKTFLETLVPEHLYLLDIIGNLDGISDFIIRQPLTNVREIRFVDSDFRIEDSAYDMPPFPHLKCLELDFQCSRRRQSLEVFVHRLAKERRPKVKFLSISYQQAVLKAMNIGPIDLCASFVNLRSLTLEGWKGGDAEWLNLWPLVGNTLVELFLWNSPNLSDRGILGDDLSQPAFLQLKYLDHLSLERKWNPKNGKITELSFIHAFRHMRLRQFTFAGGEGRNRRLGPKVMNATWNGAMRETMEEFSVEGKDLMRTRPRGNEKRLIGRVDRKKTGQAHV